MDISGAKWFDEVLCIFTREKIRKAYNLNESTMNYTSAKD